MAYDLSKLLVIGISSSALFDLRAEHQIFLKRGMRQYVDYQVVHEREPLAAGTALPLVRALLSLNQIATKSDQRLVEVVIVSQTEPEAGLRIMNSVEHHKLDITRAAFTGGAPVGRYLKTFNVTLFLSTNEYDVKESLSQGIAAGLLYDPPDDPNTELEQLRIAFDGDAVIFSDESERVYREGGLDAFVAHERKNAKRLLPEGPFAPFLKAIAKIQREWEAQEKTEGVPPIVTALVTARGSPSHTRVFLTLRAWGVKLDEMFFLGGVSKESILHQFKPHIFFDDQDVHAKPASRLVPSARVVMLGDPDPEQRRLPFAGAITKPGDASAKAVPPKIPGAKAPSERAAVKTRQPVKAKAPPKVKTSKVKRKAPEKKKPVAAKPLAPRPAPAKPVAAKPAPPKPPTKVPRKKKSAA